MPKDTDLHLSLDEAMIKRTIIEVPVSIDSPPLYRIQPFSVEKGTWFAHNDDNRFSLKGAPCCYLSDDYQTAFKEAMHYMIKMAIKAKELDGDRPILTRTMLQNKGVWRVLLPKKIKLLDLTTNNVRNKFHLDFHPGLHANYAEVRVFAQRVRNYAIANPKLNIQGFYYPTQNMGRTAIAVWQESELSLSKGAWSKDTLWDVIAPFREELAEAYYIAFYNN